MMDPVQVDIEYCTICAWGGKCKELKDFIIAAAPNTIVNCHRGSQGAFEVSLNSRLIYSKLGNKTFPEYGDIAKNVSNLANNEPLIKVRPSKNECTIL